MKLTLLDGVTPRAFQTEPVADRAPIVGMVVIALAEEIELHHRRLEESPRSKTRTWAEFIAPRLKEWNVDGEDGAPLPITAENIIRIPYPEQIQLREAVTGYLARPPAA